METDRRRGLAFWTPAPLSPPTSDTSEGGSAEEEEQGHVYSGMDRSGLEQALDQIGLGQDEMGPGPHCREAGLNINQDKFQLLPTEGDYDDLLDSGLPLMIGADLDGSDDEDFAAEENSHTPTRFLTDTTPEKHYVPEEPSSAHHCPQDPARAASLPLLIPPEEASAGSAIVDENLPEIPSWDSSTSSQTSPRSITSPEMLIHSNSHNPPAETRALNGHYGQSKIPVKVSTWGSPEDSQLGCSGPSKARSSLLKSSCQIRPSPVPKRGAQGTPNAPQEPLFRIRTVLRPDFSKVEPRVRFPKDGYRPPKSRCPLRSGALSPEPPLMFKSPADIVKEVLLTPDPREESSPVLEALAIVPPEFRSRQQAIALMDELQEDNYRLKIKLAEKENTIDRLRLEAKVNLFSDPPKPGLPLHSGLRTQASQPLTLEIPHTHRAEFSSSPQTGTNTSTSGGSCSDVFDRLYHGAQQFLHNVEVCERSLHSGTEQPEKHSEVIRALSHKLDTLEKCYLFAKREHTQHQRQCERMDHFDPERALESLIFQCGQRMDEVKERVQTTAVQSVSGHSAAERLQHRSSPTSTSAGKCQSVAAELYKKVQRFLQNVEDYEAMLQSGKLQTEQQMKVDCELTEKLDTLEKEYAFAKEEHRRQKMGSFDPGREVESLVVQCGLQMDELRDGLQSSHSPTLTTPTQAPPTGLTTPTHASPIHQDPPTGLTPPAQASPSQQATPSQQAPPLSLSPPTRQATPTLPRQTPPFSANSTVDRIQLPVSSFTPTVWSSTSDALNQALKSMFLQNKGGADQPDSTQLFQSHKVLPKPLVLDLSEDPRRVTECDFDEFRRLSTANTQTPHPSRRNSAPSPGPSALPSPPSVRSRPSPPLHPPIHGASAAGHPSTRGSVDLSQAHIHGTGTGGSEVGHSPSSSLSSLRDAPQRTDIKVPSERQRGFTQDGVISPETDSGFLGSEGSRLTPAAAASPVHQREPPGVSRAPLVDPAPVLAVTRPGQSGRGQQQSRRSWRGERRRASSASHSQHHRGGPTQRAAERDGSLTGHNRLHSSSTSEEDQSERSSTLSLRRHGNLHKDPHPGREAGHSEALDLLQAEVLRLKYNMDTFVRSRDRAERRQPSTSTPVSRPDRHKAGYRDQLERLEPEEEAILVKSQTDQRKSVTNKTSQTEHHCPAQVSRLTQTSADHCARSQAAHALLGPSTEKNEAENRPSKAPVCPECISRGTFRDRSFKGNPSKHVTPCPSCRLCGPTEAESFSPRGAQTIPSHRHVHHVTMCPHPLLLHSCPPPVHLYPVKSEGPLRLRGFTEGRSRRSASADMHLSLDTSLNRALRAAWSMKYTSRHMVHTLASGLQYQHTLHHTR